MIIKCVKTGYLEENCYVISKNDKCLIIDPGADFYKIKNLVGEKEVLAVLVTHYHADHIGALKDCIKKYNVDVIDYNSILTQKIGPFSFEIIRTMGHKDDAVTYYFKDDAVMFVGDFIFKGSIGRCDLPGGNIFEMKNSLKNIKKYDGNIILYPGHGSTTLLKDEVLNNPYMKDEELNYE